MANGSELTVGQREYHQDMVTLIREAASIVSEALPLFPPGEGENMCADRRNFRQAALTVVLDDMTAGPGDDE